MRPDDVATYRPIVSCAISHDGRWAAIAVPRYARSADARPLEVRVAPLDGPLRWRSLGGGRAADAAFGPSFAPCSTRIAVFRAIGDQATAHVYDLTRPQRPPTPLVGLPPRAATIKWRGAPGQPCCLGDDADGWRRIWSWERPGVAPGPVTPVGVQVGDYALDPAGQRIAWLSIPDIEDPASERLPLHLSGAGGGDLRTLRVPGRPVGYLAWSPDGRWLAYLARRAGHRLSTARLWIVDPARWPDDPTAARCLTPEPLGRITGYDWLPGGRELVLATTEGTWGRLTRVPLDDVTAVTPIGPRRSFVSGPHADRVSGRLLHLQQDGDVPQRLVVTDTTKAHARPRRLTRFGRRLAERGLARPETVTWSTPDGLTLSGTLLAPAGAGPLPLLVWLHGGPAESVARTFSPYFQVFAAAGAAVFAPNYRGSSGGGDALLRRNIGDLGGLDVEDVLGGVDRLVQRGVADLERTALIGWSYGGTLALLTAARSATIQAVVVGAPVVDWVSFFGAPRLPALYHEYFPGTPWADRGLYDRASPITHIADIHAPTLVVHGELDPVVPPDQSRLLYRALKARRVPTDLMLYPGEGHVLGRPLAVADMLRRVLAWCAAHGVLPSPA